MNLFHTVINTLPNTEPLKLFQQHTKMFNLDTGTSKNDNKTWPYRMLIIGPSGSGKTNTLLT